MSKPQDIDTYSGWLLHGRAVRTNQKAWGWAYHRDDGRRIAVFHRDQTEPYQQIDWNAVKIVAREDAPAPDQMPKGTTVRVALKLTGELSPAGTLAVWAGPHKDLIEMLKRSQFEYDIASARWTTYREDAILTLEALKKFCESRNLRVKEEN